MASSTASRVTTLLSSVLLRFFSYFFLRWIPGHHLPPLVLTALAIYATSFYFQTQSWTSSPAVSHRKSTSSASSKNNGSTARQRKTHSPQGKSAKELVPNSTKVSTIQHVTWTLISGLPSPHSLYATVTTALINIILSLMVIDLVFRGPYFHSSEDLSFIRVGYINTHSAKLLIREPNPDHMPLSVSYRQPNTTWKNAASWVSLNSSTDFTASFTISNLLSETAYEYSSSTGYSGTFTTAAKPSHLSTNRSYDSSSRLTFVTTSCIKAHFPYNPLDHPLRLHGLEHLSEVLPSLKASFMLFLGDFIYVDVPLRFGFSAANYRREYRQVYSSPSWSGPVGSLPWLHVMDDHEIANDWDKKAAHPYPAAVDPFRLYQHPLNPDPVTNEVTYYEFQRGPVSFFMLDTRRYRDLVAEMAPMSKNKTMLGNKQREAVLRWIARQEKGVKFKVLVSSVPFTRNWRVNALDTWAGYLWERQVLLEAMWDAASGYAGARNGSGGVEKDRGKGSAAAAAAAAATRNKSGNSSAHGGSAGGNGYGFVVLSGDRHEFAATKFPAPVPETQQQPHRATENRTRWTKPDGSPAVVHEFSCSPLSMFYLPFPSYAEHHGESSGVGMGGEDQQLAYIPGGNSKFGAVEVVDADALSTLKYTLFVDGKEKWQHLLTL